MLSDDKITDFFCIADDFCKFFNETGKKHTIEDGKSTGTFRIGSLMPRL